MLLQNFSHSIMSGHFVCLFCSSVFKSKSKGKRHSVTHLPWYFGNILCIICEQRFEVKQKLFEHCETKGHQRKLDANKARFDVQSERRQFVEIERCTYSQVIIGFIEENFTEKEFFTNFDRPDGIIDRLDLFPDSPKRVTMNTPELDSVPQDMVVCNGMLPMEFPRMSTSLGPIDPSTFTASMDEVSPQGGSSNATLSQRSTDVHPMVEELPDPPERPTKRARSQSAPVGPADDRLAAVVSKLQAIEGKIDSLNKKVVDTAESQTADLKNRLSKLEECVEHNTTQVQGYSKMLAMTLQRDITKVLETVGQLGKVQGSQVSPEMLSALVTLSREAMKMYQSPYQPKDA